MQQRGEGEKQIEVDRRLLRRQKNQLAEELEHVRTHRQLHREHRKDTGAPVLALVGYTNASKSTLLNQLASGGCAWAPLPTTRGRPAPGLRASSPRAARDDSPNLSWRCCLSHTSRMYSIQNSYPPPGGLKGGTPWIFSHFLEVNGTHLRGHIPSNHCGPFASFRKKTKM